MHLPVLKNEVIRYLNPEPNENFIDATAGELGHSLAILERNRPRGKVLGIDCTPELVKKLALQVARHKLQDRLILVNDSYVNIKKIAKEHSFGPVRGILFDLGLSSWHLEKSGRGFSFQKDEPLDMRFSITHFERSLEMCYQLTAEDIVNKWQEKEIETILREYGQESFAKRIAREIIKTRKLEPIKTTFQLVEIIKRAMPKSRQRNRPRTAARTFQALRIAVNNELENLKAALPPALELLEAGGRLAVISFHSGEDRIVKNFFRENGKKGLLKIITKKPVRPSPEEVQKNPRSRSAKLRAAVKI